MPSQWNLGGAFRLSSLADAITDVTAALRRLEAWVRSPVVIGDAQVNGDTTVGGAFSVTGAASVGGNLLVTTTRDFLFDEGSGNAYGALFRQSTTAATVLGSGVRFSSTAGGFASSTSVNWGRSAVGCYNGYIGFLTGATTTTAVGTDVTMTERMRVHQGGGISIGDTTDPGAGVTRIADVALLVPRASAPSTPTDGMVYYDSTTNKLRVRAAGAWVDLH